MAGKLLLDHVPPEMVWQVLMAIHFLGPFGLYVADNDRMPLDFFCYNQPALNAFVLRQNPSLAETVCHLANPNGRPVLIGMTSLAVTTSILPSNQQRLVPVTSTSLLTGVISNPVGIQQHVGGGAVVSFAFNSSAESFGQEEATVSQDRQWSLTDILGASSAAFAESLIKEAQHMTESPVYFAAAAQKAKPHVKRKLARSVQEAEEIEALLDAASSAALLGAPEASEMHGAITQLSLPQSIVPKYNYWPQSAPLAPGAAIYDFADGGSLENSGVAAMLTTGATVLIAFVNSMTRMEHVGNNTVLDTCVPPLFGYQPWDKDTNAYYLYGDPKHPPKLPIYGNNRVFDPAAFQDLQDGLWASQQTGAYPVFVQKLTTLENEWFGVERGTPVTVVWFYLDMSSDWKEELDDVVKAVVDGEVLLHHFPNYPTDHTGLSKTQVNLLSNLTAWAVGQNSGVLKVLLG